MGRIQGFSGFRGGYRRGIPEMKMLVFLLAIVVQYPTLASSGSCSDRSSSGKCSALPQHASVEELQSRWSGIDVEIVTTPPGSNPVYHIRNILTKEEVQE